MGEKLKALGRTDDLSALPASEFGPHGAIDARVKTTLANKARDGLHSVSLSLQALKSTDGETPALERALHSVHAAWGYLEAHVVAKRDLPGAEIEYLR